LTVLLDPSSIRVKVARGSLSMALLKFFFLLQDVGEKHLTRISVCAQIYQVEVVVHGILQKCAPLRG
jgi:hypothetical protein